MPDRSHSLLRVTLQEQGGYSLHLLGPLAGDENQLLQHRLPCLQPFLRRAAQRLTQLGHRTASFAVQLHDEEPALPCFRFDAPLAPDSKGPLIPDPYVLGTQGYASLRKQFEEQPLPAWRERLPIAIWRGSSTGTEELNEHTITSNQRYQLCRHSLILPHRLDARFTAVVQTPDGSTRAKLEEKLRNETLLTPRMDPWYLALHRWILEIDGNVNSWGLLWKLLSGSCVVKVASERQQWYHHTLKPWQHFVPLHADLSDLEAVLVWCQEHGEACESIAQAGQALATDVIRRLDEAQDDAIDAYVSWQLAQSA
jgi:hypothetical protein